MANEFKIRKGLIVEGASGGVVVNVLGSQGQLLSVTDNLSGSIFAVSDISGVPIFDVNSSGLSTFDGLVSGITPVNAANFVTKAYVDGSGGGTGPFLPLAGGTMTTGAVVTFLDSGGSTDNRLKFGTGGDMQLFHDGTASHIVSSGSDLRFDVPNFIVRSSSGTESIIRATQNAAVELYYNNSKKFETTDIGVTFSNLATTSASTPSTPVDEVKIGTFGAGRPALFLGTSNTTYSNSTWFIENIGASGKFRIGRNGLDVIEISNSGDTTFAGKVITTELESTGALLLDAVGDITIDAGGGDIILSDDATIFGTISSSGGMQIRSRVNNADMFFRGVDDGAEFNALTLDMSEGGNATFAGTISSGGIIDMNSNKITELSPGTTNLDAVNYQQLSDAIAGVLVYQGTWNAFTNTPTLASGVGTPGYYYIVSVAGSTNLDGITDWLPGDWAIFSDLATDAWQKIDHTNVLNGAGTGQKVTKWDGSGTSYALTNGPITFSTNDSTFAGNAIFTNGVAFSSAASIRQQSDILILTGGGNGFAFNDDSNAVSNLLINAGGEATFSSNVTITGNALVGSGTIDNPQGWGKILQVQNSGNNGASLSVKDSNNEWNLATYNNYFYISDNVEERLIIDVNGNVGIGVAPVEKLDVYQSATGAGVADFRHVNGNRILVNPSYNYYDAYNHIFRGLNGTDTHMTIDLDGRVGINTTTPSSYDAEGDNLVVFDATTPGITIATSTTTSRGSLLFADGITGSEKYRGGVIYDHGTGMGGAADTMYLRAAVNSYLALNPDGNVGIGTKNPNSQLSGTYGLSIVNSGNASLGLSNGTNHWLNYLGGTKYRFWNNSVNEVMTLTYAGDVGIGVDDPQAKLEVKGVSATPGDGNEIISVTNTLGGSKLLLGVVENSYGWIQSAEGATYRNLLLNPLGGNVGIGVTGPATLLSNTITRIGNADGLTANLSACNWEVNGQGYTAAFSNLSTTASQYNAGLLVELASTDATDKILDLESGGVNRVRVLGNGNVGIGLDPIYKLDVRGDRIRLNPNSDDFVAHEIQNTTGSFYLGIDNTSGTAFGGAASARTIFSQQAYPIAFYTNSTEKMSISAAGAIKFNAYDSTNNTGTPTYLLGTDASGNVVKTLSSAAPGSLWAASGNDIYNTNSANVGIGTTIPVTKLEVNGTASTRNALSNVLTINGGESVSNPYDGFGVGTVFRGRDYSNALRDYAYIYGVISGNTSSSTPAGDPGFKSELRFYTNTGGASATLPTQKMVINSAGNVGIGITTDPVAKLDVKAAQGGMGAYFFTNHNSAVSDGHVYINSDQVLAPFTALKVRQAGTGPILLLTGTAAAGEVLRVTSGGNVGIGISTPQTTLQVNGTENQFNAHFGQGANNTDGYFGGISLGYAENGNTGYRKVGIVSKALGDGAARADLCFLVDIAADGNSAGIGDTKMMIDGITGYVGIGTSNPGNLLDVQGDTDISGQLVVSHNANYVAKIVQLATSMSNASYTFEVDSSSHTSNMSTAGAMSVDVDSGRAFTINGLGNVGIGTDDPVQKLQVNGQVLFRTTTVDGGKNRFQLIPGGSSDAANLYLYYGNTGDGTLSVRINAQGDSYFNGGNVGIGNTNPLNKLTVQASNTGTQATTIPVGKFINTGNSFSKLILGSDNANFDGVVSMDNDSTLADTKLRIYIGNGTSATTGHSNDHIVLQGNGNVGIGTSTPLAKLDIQGTQGQLFSVTDNLSGSIFAVADISGVPILDVNSNGKVGINTTSAADIFDVRSPSWATRIQSTVDGTYLRMSPNQIATFNSANAGSPLYINNSSSGNIIMAGGGGNVGIGTTSPAVPLDVEGKIRSSNDNSGSYLEMFNDGDVSGNSFITSTSGEMIIKSPDDITFLTNSSERMRIDGGGEVGINETSPSATLHLTALSSSGVPFKLVGDPATTTVQQLIRTEQYSTSITAWYNIVCEAKNSSNNIVSTFIVERDGDVKNANNVYGQISDIRLKENILDATPKLEDIKKLKVKNFNFIGDELKQIGLIAQEVEEIFPGLVKEDMQPGPDGTKGGVYKSVKYSIFVPMMIKAMQEQQEIIENLTTRIEQLEN